MEVIRKNLKEDIPVLVSLGEKYGGEPFRLVFTSGKYGIVKYVCEYNGNTYKNCEMADDTHVLCLLDNHGLPCGLVSVELSFFLPNGIMPDGNHKLNDKRLLEFEYEGKMYHLELTNGKSDTIVTPEVKFDLLGTVLRGKALTWDDLTDEQKAQLKGERGEQGERGADGRDGADGKDGRDGVDGGIIYPEFTLDPHNMHLYVKDGANRLRVADDGHLKIRFNNNA